MPSWDLLQSAQAKGLNDSENHGKDYGRYSGYNLLMPLLKSLWDHPTELGQDYQNASGETDRFIKLLNQDQEQN